MRNHFNNALFFYPDRIIDSIKILVLSQLYHPSNKKDFIQRRSNSIQRRKLKIFRFEISFWMGAWWMEEGEKLTRQLCDAGRNHTNLGTLSRSFAGAIQLAWTDGSFIGYNY